MFQTSSRKNNYCEEFLLTQNASIFNKTRKTNSGLCLNFMNVKSISR